MSTPDCLCNPQTASATSQATAPIQSGDIVTASASATASSYISYKDALATATKESQQLATDYAQHDAHVINQTLNIINSRSLIPTNTNITL